MATVCFPNAACSLLAPVQERGGGRRPEDRDGEGGAPKLHYRVCFNLTVFNLF